MELGEARGPLQVGEVPSGLSSGRLGSWALVEQDRFGCPSPMHALMKCDQGTGLGAAWRETLSAEGALLCVEPRQLGE